MKSKVFLVFLMTFVALAVIASVVSATSSLAVDINPIEVDGMTAPNIALVSGDTVPVTFELVSSETTDVEQVQISAWLQGHKSETLVEKDFADLISGKTYKARLALNVPTELDDTEEVKTLYIRVESDKGTKEENISITIQRKPYNAGILFMEADSSVTAGSNLPVDIVIKNDGRHNLKDMVLSVKILELGIEKKAYLGKLVANDTCNDNCDNEVESASETVSLKIPSDAKAGTYTLVVEAYNDDTSVKTSKSIVISGAEDDVQVLTALASKNVGTDESVTYDIVIVNSGNRIAVFEIVPETTQNLAVSADESIVTVPAGSSKVVRITAKANDVIGTVNFGVNINSEGQLVKRVNLAANVTKGKAITSNVVALTIVLAVIFVVLLIVLIVLLTRKPAKTEEFGESYY